MKALSVRRYRSGIALVAAAVFQIEPASAQAVLRGSVVGTVTDSLNARPLAGVRVYATRLTNEVDSSIVATSDSVGRFRFTNLEAGQYALGFTNELLDSLELGGALPRVNVPAGDSVMIALAIPSSRTLRARVCPGFPFPERTGALSGLVTNVDKETPLAGADVLVAWTSARSDSATGMSALPKMFAARADENGQYHMCGVPTDEPIMVQVQSGERAGGAIRVMVPGTIGVAVQNLVFSEISGRPLRSAGENASRVELKGNASLAGRVFTHNGTPLAGARIRVIDAGNTITDEGGQFKLNSLPAGTHDIEVSRIGYGMVRHAVDLRDRSTVQHDIRLDRLIMLDSVDVVAQRTIYIEFENHRKLAAGKSRFLSEEQIDAFRDHVNSVSDMLNYVPGWAGKAINAGSDAVVPGCAVVVDNMKEFPISKPGTSQGGGPLNVLLPSEVGAMEFYSQNPVGTAGPMQFHERCLIMIWSKRWVEARATKTMQL